MSEQKSQPSNSRTVIFIVILCFVCALVLAVLATALAPAEQRARELDVAKQQLAAARIYNPRGYFQIQDESGKFVPAKYDEAKGMLVPGTTRDRAGADEIYAISRARLIPLLTDEKGKVSTFEAAGIDRIDYMQENAKRGFYMLPEKLFFAIMSNDPSDKTPVGFILPVNGFGLWGPVYGYLAIADDGYTLIGATFEGPMETPGLGAIIQDPAWQAQFEGKDIFLPGADGTPNLETAPVGVVVVKGKVSDVFGDAPRAQTAVDGITGATLTGDGVTAALADSLAPYRQFLTEVNKSKGAVLNGS